MSPTFATLLILLTISRNANSCFPFRKIHITSQASCKGSPGAGEPSSEVCSLPVSVGDCQAGLARYYFDTKTSKCQLFKYGGCGGNENNFATEHDCMKMCRTDSGDGTPKPTTAASQYDCTSPPEKGICMAHLERYAYHPKASLCSKFVYGGCGGNGNNYRSWEECQRHCARPQTTRIEPISEPTTTAPPPPTTPAPFVCPKPYTRGSWPALFRDPQNCARFYACVNGVPSHKKCIADTLFNPVLKVCDWPANVPDCGVKTMKPTTTALPPTTAAAFVCPKSRGLFRDPQHCRNYYKCVDGTPTRKSCEADLLFNPVIGACDWPTAVADCDLKTMKPLTNAPPPPTEPAKFVCPKPQGRFRDPRDRDCRYYQQCQDGVATRKQCPFSLYFNSELGVCDHPGNVKGC